MAKTMGRSRRSLTLFVSFIFLLIVILGNTYRTWSLMERPGNNDLVNCSQHGTRTTLNTRAHHHHHLNNPTPLPYKCGMVFFYHVPSTGGATLNQWLSKYTSKSDDGKDGDGKYKYFTAWDRARDGQAKEYLQTSFINGTKRRETPGMNNFVKNLTSNEWRIAHCHHSSLHLNISEHLLTRWRHSVEEQGCHFIAHVIFRDPLGHALSLLKHVTRDEYGVSREDWFEHLRTISDTGPWQTQLDYFLYNILARNPDGVSKETKVKRALDLLRDHFDIVTIGNHDKHKNQLLKMTGWQDLVMARENSYQKDISTTKREVEDIQKLLDQNGDTDFMEGVKYMYKELS